MQPKAFIYRYCSTSGFFLTFNENPSFNVDLIISSLSIKDWIDESKDNIPLQR
jgi:hypothetical protein